MKKRTNQFTIAISIILLLQSCINNSEYKPKNLIKVTNEEMLNRAKNHDLPNSDKIIFKDMKGMTLTIDSLIKIEKPENYAQDYYKNKNGTIQEIVIRPAKKEDKIFRNKMDNAIKEGPDVNMVDIDCANKVQILQNVFDSDQEIRKNGNQIDKKIDHKNLEIIVSFIEKCGIPSKDEVDDVQMAAIWAVLQHNSNRWRKKYLPLLEESAKKGDLGWGTIAMMKDRTLLGDNEPQIYGTQIRDNKLYDLLEPEYVNKRRKEIGLEPIEEYLKRWDIKFDIPQKE